MSSAFKWHCIGPTTNNSVDAGKFLSPQRVSLLYPKVPYSSNAFQLTAHQGVALLASVIEATQQLGSPLS
ncbi:MAG: hypothetical protein JOZ78_04855 [Chroococcidiopsidaceae cyanobacterium CP_BM_ER_R8_30]|nr:hypothetical protein [Chroococcidiopsidaceae cyanobacterium CP_BM_ER_R8_30]